MSRNSREGAAIYTLIKDAIQRLEMRPGSVIDEAEIAARINVSRTPVREAIIQLIADELVIRDGRSARVAPLDFAEVPKLYDALLVSSRMVHRLAAENRTAAQLKSIETAMNDFEEGIASSDGLGRSELNVAFHICIANAAHSVYFENFYKKMLLATSRLARACFSGDGRYDFDAAYPEDDITAHMNETARQHRLMFEAIADRDIEASDRMAAAHEALAKGRLRAALFRTSGAVGNASLVGEGAPISLRPAFQATGLTATKQPGARQGIGARGSG